jgi:uncharacterized protein (DUF58 family)
MFLPTAWRSRKPRLRITREGWYWLLTAGFLLVVGWFKAINLILLLAYPMLALWAVNVFLAWRRPCTLRVRRLCEGPVFARTPFRMELEVENPHRIAQVGLHLKDYGPDHALSWYVPRLARGDKVRLRGELTLPRRGWYGSEALRASNGYPFGLAERGLRVEGDQAILVFPPLGRLHPGRLRRVLRQAAMTLGPSRQRPRRHPTAQSQFHGLRSFRPGDSPRWIHWRTSARRGELMVREFEDEPANDFVLVVDPWLPAADANAWRVTQGGAAEDGPPPRSMARLEAALSLAATICWEWCRHKGDRFVLALAGPVPLVVDGLTSREHALLMLECLAVHPGSPEPAADRLAERLAALPLPAAPILVISTHPSGLGDALAARLQRPVVTVDVSARAGCDFFERASGHAP